MLDFQLKQTPFRYGLAEGDDPHAVPFGVLTKLENYVWKKTNRVEKRLGTEWLGRSKSGGGTLSATLRLFSRGKNLCLIDGENLYSYSSLTSTWTLVDRVPATGLTWVPLVDTTDGVAASDTFVSGDFVVTAWMEGDPTSPITAGGELWVQIARLNGEGMYLAATSLNAGAVFQGIRVLVIGNTAILVTTLTGLNNIYAFTIDLTTLAIAGPTVVANNKNVSAVQNWNADIIAGSDDFILSFRTTAAATVRLNRVSSALAPVANASLVIAGSVVDGIAVCATEGESVYVILRDTTSGDILLYCADPTTLAQVGATLVFSAGTYFTETVVGICRLDATRAVGVFSTAAANGFVTESKVVDNTATIVANTTRMTNGTLICCQPFVLSGKAYVFASNLAQNYFDSLDAFLGVQCAMLELYDGHLVAGSTANQHRYVGNADTLLGAMTRVTCPLGQLRAASTTEIIGSLSFIGTAPNINTFWRCGLRLLRVTAGVSLPKDLWRSALSGVESHFCCGTFSVYDGSMVFDYGFACAPVFLNVIGAGAGGEIQAGAYLYAVVLEFRGAADVLYRSSVGYHVTPVSTAGAASLVTLDIINTNVGNKRHVDGERYPTQVAVHRTVVGGSVPQRLALEPAVNVLRNDYNSGLQQYVDTRADTSIDAAIGVGLGMDLAARPAVYTAGGELNDQAPPAQVTMFTHVDRLWVLDGSELAWWFSKRFSDNAGVAPGFNTAFRVVLMRKQVAGASMDDKAIFFSESGIDYMLGVGPAKDGSGNDFSTPVRVQSDVGCSNARSVVPCPDGIMFASVRGIYLLTRGLELVWIGRPVQDTLALFPDITSATLVAHRNEIRFTANNTERTEGVVLVYNYIEKQWSTSRYYDGVSDTHGCPIADACMWNGAWTFATPGGAVYKEVLTHHFDDGDTYSDGIIETAWNSASGPIAYHAVRNFWIQGVSHSDHDLSIEIAFDSNNTYQQIREFPALSPVTSVGDLEEAKISVGKRRKCNSIRFKVTDSAPTTIGSLPGTGKGPSFATMGYEVGVKKGDNTPKGKKG